MQNIKILSPELANKIAAGEVVERPVSVVKELVENSLDAGATKIIVEIKKGGIEQISISDNGSGIPRNAVAAAFLRHATSKLADEEDLYKISTMGFRGEALSSISAVSEVMLITRTADEEIGTQLTLNPNGDSEVDDIGCNVGTTLIVNRLFANVPARMKFLKRDATETAYITDVLGKIALAAPNVSFKYITDGETIFATSGDGSLRNAVFEIYGKDCAKALMDMNYTEQNIKISGVLGTAEISRGNRARQTIFVNGRYVKNHVLSKVVEDAYKTLLTVGKFPFFVMNIEVPYDSVDVNVHPAKTEIKFSDERYVCRELYRAVKLTLDGRSVGQSFVGANSVRPQEAPNKWNDKKNDVNWQPIHEILSNKVSDVGHEKVAEYETKYDKFRGENVVSVNIQTPPRGFEFNEGVSEPVPAAGSANLPDGLHSERSEPYKIIGQIFETYLLVEQGNQFYIIDQHAAHERINYERVMAQLKSQETIAGQILLTPEIIRFTATEKAEILENIDVFSSLGFVLEDFGASEMLVRETPVQQSADMIKENIFYVLKLLQRHVDVDFTDIREKALHNIACKSSIRAGRKLKLEEAEGLLTQIDDLGNINTCPHGRPIKVIFTKPELEKMFKRG